LRTVNHNPTAGTAEDEATRAVLASREDTGLLGAKAGKKQRKDARRPPLAGTEEGQAAGQEGASGKAWREESGAVEEGDFGSYEELLQMYIESEASKRAGVNKVDLLEKEGRALQTRLNSVLYHTYVVEAKGLKQAQQQQGRDASGSREPRAGGWAGVRRPQGQNTHYVHVEDDAR